MPRPGGPRPATASWAAPRPRRWSGSCPAGEYAEVADAGHLVHYDQPDAWRAAIEPFLDGVLARQCRTTDVRTRTDQALPPVSARKATAATSGYGATGSLGSSSFTGGRCRRSVRVSKAPAP